MPIGPLYAYQIVRENTVVTPLGPKDGWERFAVHHNLDPQIYDNAVTLTFVIPATAKVEARAGGKAVPEKTAKLTDRWNVDTSAATAAPCSSRSGRTRSSSSG